MQVLPAGSGVQQLTRLDDGQQLRLVSALDELEDDFDLVLLDSGAGIGDNVLFFIGAAQEALLVVSPEPTSLTDAYATVKVLCQDAGVRYFNVVVNQARTEAVARDIFEKLAQVSGRFLDARIRCSAGCPATRTCTAPSWPSGRWSRCSPPRRSPAPWPPSPTPCSTNRPRAAWMAASSSSGAGSCASRAPDERGHGHAPRRAQLRQAQQAGPPLTDDEVVRRFSPLIDRVARRIAARTANTVQPGDLWSVGALGLLDA